MENAPENLKTLISYVHVLSPEWEQKFVWFCTISPYSHHSPQSSYSLKARVPCSWEPKGCNIQGIKESNEKNPQYWNQIRYTAYFLTVKEKTHIEKFEYNHTPDWERTTRVGRMGGTPEQPHAALPVSLETSLPRASHSYQWGNSQPDSIQGPEPNELANSSNLCPGVRTVILTAFLHVHKLHSQCTYTVDAKLRPKI